MSQARHQTPERSPPISGVGISRFSSSLHRVLGTTVHAEKQVSALTWFLQMFLGYMVVVSVYYVFSMNQEQFLVLYPFYGYVLERVVWLKHAFGSNTLGDLGIASFQPL